MLYLNGFHLISLRKEFDYFNAISYLGIIPQQQEDLVDVHGGQTMFRPIETVWPHSVTILYLSHSTPAKCKS